MLVTCTLEWVGCDIPTDRAPRTAILRLLSPSDRDMVEKGKGRENKSRGEENKDDRDEGERQTATRVTVRRFSDEQARER